MVINKEQQNSFEKGIFVLFRNVLSMIRQGISLGMVFRQEVSYFDTKSFGALMIIY